MIDLKKFKKVSSDQHTTTLRHDDGHEFKVVHSVLSPKLAKDLEKLPSYPNGGKVSSKDVPGSPNSSSTKLGYGEAALQELGQQRGIITTSGTSSGLPEDAPPSPVEEMILPMHPSPQISEGQQGGLLQQLHGGPGSPSPSTPAPQVPEESSGLSVLSGPSQPQENPLITKINQITAPNPELAQQVQGAYKQNLNQNQHIAQAFQNSKAQIDAEHQALVHDIMNKHIDMSDYWKANDKGAAALGALLGGMGSGLTHLANPVPSMIANSQENFLKAELANMDNPKSLLSAVQAQYGNNQNAADMMRIISNEALNAHLQQVMAPLNSQQAQANAAQVQLALLQNTEALKQQIAMRQALSSGASTQMDPSQKALLMYRSGMLSDKQYEQANKEIGQSTKLESLRDDLLKSYDDLNKKAFAGALSPRDRQSAIDAFSGSIAHITEGRINGELAQKQINAILPHAFESNETRANKLQRLNAIIDTFKDDSTLKGLGIKVPQQGQVTVIAPNGQSGNIPRSQLQQALQQGYKQVQ